MNWRTGLLSAALLLLASGAALAQQQPAPETALPSITFFGDGNYLGIYSEDITKEDLSRYGLREPQGVRVTRVLGGSPAERAGLRKDDVILKFDGESVTSVRKLNRLINEAAPEHTARLSISRNGVEQDLSVTLGKRDVSSSIFREGNPGTTVELQRQLENLSHNGQGAYTFLIGGGRRIGVSTTPLTRQLADYFGVSSKGGVLITSVRENTPAAKAGLKAGDVITEADGKAIGSLEDLLRAINSKEEGEINLTIVRDKKQRAIQVTPERSKWPGVELAPDFQFWPAEYANNAEG